MSETKTNAARQNPDLISSDQIKEMFGVDEVVKQYRRCQSGSRPRTYYRISEIEKCLRNVARRERIEKLKMTPEERAAYIERMGWSPRQTEGGVE